MAPSKIPRRSVSSCTALSLRERLANHLGLVCGLANRCARIGKPPRRERDNRPSDRSFIKRSVTIANQLDSAWFLMERDRVIRVARKQKGRAAEAAGTRQRRPI